MDSMRLRAEAKQSRIRAKVEQQRVRQELESALERARALREYPELLKLRELESLSGMARKGARFVVGFSPGERNSLLGDGD